MNTNWMNHMKKLEQDFYTDIDRNFCSIMSDLKNQINKSTEIVQNETYNYNENTFVNNVKHEADMVCNFCKEQQNQLVKSIDKWTEILACIVKTTQIGKNQYNTMAKRRAMLLNIKFMSISNFCQDEMLKLRKSFLEDIPIFISYFSNKEDNNINVNENKDIFEIAKEKYNKLFSRRDLIKFLEENGFEYKNTGRHANYSNGTNTIPVPTHGAKDLGYGLQRQIQKDVMKYKKDISN